MTKRLSLIPLCAALVAGCSGSEPPADGEAGAPIDAAQSAMPRTAFVHLFEWPWPAIAHECESFLGPNGYAAVQVSPPQEHATGPQWYTRYQPVSYRLESRGGTREEFVDMVERCAAVGVDIYVDAVINHMTGVRPDAVGVAGTAYSEYEYPPLYGYDDFNHCGRRAGNDIEDYNDRWEMQNCELVNLADLKTSSEKVRDTLAAYLNDLLGVGVAGFRIDAAKHMPVEDVEAIMSRVGPEYFVFQEVLTPDSSVVDRAAYARIGPLTEFQYETRVAEAFEHGAIDKLRDLGEVDDMLPSEDAVVFVDNHDSQRGDHVLTYKDGRRYILANVFMLAHPYGYPKVMSSFEFDQRDQGAPQVPPIAAGATACADGWVCEHRTPDIVTMVKFRNAMHGEALVHWQEHANGGLSFGRGGKGHVALNPSDAPIELVVTTDLPAGSYCNLLDGIGNADACAEANVVNGELRLSLPPLGAVVIRRD